MATKSYREQASAVLFRAARDMRKVAGQVLDDSVLDNELTSPETHTWVRQTARKYSELATDLEAQACEALGFFDRPAATRRSQQAYSQQIDAYQRRRVAALDRKAQGVAA